MPLDYHLFYQRRLPHYQPPGAILFVTFRLAGSLPQAVIQHLEAELLQKKLQIDVLTDPQNREQTAYLTQKQLFGILDAELDKAHYGPKWLAEAAIADLMCKALHNLDGQVYTLEAYCVMPNHVHLVCTPLSIQGEVYPLSKIMQSLKGNTARQANLLLGRTGDFWQHESYDHVVRDAVELKRIVNYVLANPSRAGLATQWV